MRRPVITLLTDFGSSDHYVAAMKGVILGICPQAELVDISHEIAPYSIPEAAYTLAQACRYFPKGTTHLAVVDPGVGSKRRAIVAEAAGHRFVAPDNGLLSLILRANPKATVREVTESRFFRHPVSHTFHGRDIFAPVSAHLAGGTALKEIGTVIKNTVLEDFAEPRLNKSGHWLGTVLKIDRFGNVISNLEWDRFQWIASTPFRIKIGSRVVSHFRLTYDGAQKREIFALEGSSGYIELSMNQAHAASVLGVSAGEKFELSLDRRQSTRTALSLSNH